MTKVVISASSEATFVKVDGHTGYQNPTTGENDVCVAVSTLIGTLGRWLETKYGIFPEVEGGYFRVEINDPSESLLEMIGAIKMELEAIAEEHSEYLMVL